MKYRYKDLDKKEKIKLDNARKKSFYISHHALKRNTVFIDKEYIRSVAQNGKILLYEYRENKKKKGTMEQVLTIGNRKDDIIEGKKATLMVVVSLTGGNILTCYYRTRNEIIYNFCKVK